MRKHSIKLLLPLLLAFLMLCTASAAYAQETRKKPVRETEPVTESEQETEPESETEAEHEHIGVLIPAKCATATRNGHQAYYICTCGSWFFDAQCIREITDHSAVVIKASGQAPKPAPTPTHEEAEKGDIWVIGQLKYRITSSKAACVVGLSDVALKEAKIPETITIGDDTFQVTKIAPGAFKKSKHLSRVSLGANISEIGKGAFARCRHLRVLSVSTAKLTRKAVNGIFKRTGMRKVILKKNARKRRQQYIRYFAKSNSGKRVRIY